MMQWRPPPALRRGVRVRILHLLASHLLFISLALSAGQAAIRQGDAQIQSHLALAIAYLHADMLTLAMMEADKALEVSPEFPEALALKAVIYQHQNRTEKAERYFLLASQQAPQNSQILHNWAAFECQQGRFESSFAKFEMSLRYSEGLERDKSAWVWGRCLLQNQQWEAADLKMSPVYMRQPSFISEGLVLANLKLQLGRDKEAEKILDKVNDSPSVSAQSLWLSVQLAQRQNQAVKMNHWGKMLGLLFSNSVQWRAYQEGTPHD